MKKLLFAILIVSLLLPLAAQAAEIEGVYDCQGTNPGGNGSYKGTVSIVKNGATYNINWNIGSQAYMGVGLLEGNTFSVGYADSGKSWYGVVVYNVDGDKLVGTWAMQGSDKTGTETLDKRK